MAAWMDVLEKSVTGAGHEVIRWPAGDGHLMVLPHAARLLGCGLPGADENLLWHHPGMNEPAGAAAQLEKAGGELGGDRLWIAPEVAYMWPDLELARQAPHENHQVPPVMDPATWQISERGEGHLLLKARMDLSDHRNGRRIVLDVDRGFARLERPGGMDNALKCASWVTFNAARIVDGEEGAVAGLWDLCQMPVGGALYCPLTLPLDGPPRAYYEPLRPTDVSWDETAVRFAARAEHIIKMGLAAEKTTGRMGYYRRLDDDRASFLFRHFLPVPGAAYVDLPRDSEAMFGGDCLQAFCGDDPEHGFCEMEHHEPAVIVGQGPRLTCGSSVTHAIVGPTEKVEAAARALLGDVSIT